MKRGDGTKLVAHNCQNMTRSEITTVLTRFGRNSKYIVCGDAKQADIKDSGFDHVLKAFDTDHSEKNNIYCVHFDAYDIVRSPILKHITQVLGV
jgi:phosphate starvation-inducible protein PhoH